jgi:Fe2+ or Zn2+ uptake regulation protein
VLEHLADQQRHPRSFAHPVGPVCLSTTLVDTVEGVMHSPTQLTQLFRANGLRVTAQREAIFCVLYGDDTHPRVETVFERVQARVPAISLKTVYQTVHDLEALGEVRLLDLGTGSVRVDPNVDHAHHHLVCTRCGRIRDLPVAFDGLRVPARHRRDFTVDDVQVIFRGRCDDCDQES